MHRETVWEFKTAQFRIALEVSPEEMDPADSFEFEDDIEAVRNGDVEWFCADVAVYYKGNGIALGRDSLGGCAYNSVREFYTSHWDSPAMSRNCSAMRLARGDNVVMCEYFTSMVREAISQARATLDYLREIKIRA